MNTKKWTKKELEQFKKMILSKRAEVSDEMETLKKRADEMLKESTSNALYSSHMADASADHVEMEKAYYMIAREKKYLHCLDKAIQMIDDGTFGVCISCDEIIHKDRLLEVPHTTKCFNCKSNI